MVKNIYKNQEKVQFDYLLFSLLDSTHYVVC